MAALRSRCGHYIFIPWSLLFYSSPNLSGSRLDVYLTSTHGVALVRISNAGLKCAARGSLKIHDAEIRRGKKIEERKKKETTGQKYNVRLCYAGRPN